MHELEGRVSGANRIFVSEADFVNEAGGWGSVSPSECISITATIVVETIDGFESATEFPHADAGKCWRDRCSYSPVKPIGFYALVVEDETQPASNCFAGPHFLFEPSHHRCGSRVSKIFF
jgi:hypothetical protein